MNEELPVHYCVGPHSKCMMNGCGQHREAPVHWTGDRHPYDPDRDYRCRFRGDPEDEACLALLSSPYHRDNGTGEFYNSQTAQRNPYAKGLVETRPHFFTGRKKSPCWVAGCGQPLKSPLHYSDDWHPYVGSSQDNDQPCLYTLDSGERCGLEPESPKHASLGQKVRPARTTMREPDEPVADTEMKSKVPVFETDWESAVWALNSPEMDLPGAAEWTWRKFTLPDEGGIGGGEDDLADVMSALNALGAEFSVSVWRVAGRAWRFALITWGDYLDMNVGEISEFMERRYR